MSRPMHFYCLLFTCLLFSVSCSEAILEEKEWELVWEESFDQTSQLDTTRWSKIPRGKSEWTKYMSDFDSCYALRDGNLVLRGIANTYLPNDSVPYLTGGVYTKGKVGFSYGRLEIRAKLQGARGAWPAIWMLPQEGTWPHGGEIDIMERINDEDVAYQTVHSHYTYNLKMSSSPNNGTYSPINKDDYNVYAVEIYPDRLVFFINNKATLTYPRIMTDLEGQYPFDKPFYLMMDMQLGGPWPGSVFPEDLPVEMKIDWVRFYHLKEPSDI